MFKFENIFEEYDILEFLEKRNLIKQYKKSKSNILNGIIVGNNLRYREPKKEGVLYFRINKQYRALCRAEGNSLIVFYIDDHQN